MAVTCPSCAYENNDDARFCAGCGAALGATCSTCETIVPPGGRFCPNCGTPVPDARTAETPVEERRVVSILFADLAGFTSTSDQADPEDVRRTLIPFHTIAKEEIERFGGTLDKFVGDAAMGVFGAPVAHEDDPERAVRAALAIQARTADMAIPVRAAVNTGEAVVTFATGPQIGENVAGDVVNTASRLQGVAPHGGVVVGESTYRSTRDAVDYGELEPVEVKGKADPLRVWLAGSVRTEAPGRADEDATPFVGRERERHLLRELFDRSVRESSLQFVTIVGEPGIGKTRLVADLHEHLLTGTAPVTWYRGRCLPYGESVTFAPLEEIVREATGVMRSDDREEAAGKLADHIARLEPRATEAEWLRARLAPLIGLAEPTSTAPDRAESFTAWARFLVADRSSSPSRTCTGQTRPCSISWISWTTRPTSRPSCWWGPPGPSSSTFAPGGAEARRTLRRSRSRRCRKTRCSSCWPSCSCVPSCPPTRRHRSCRARAAIRCTRSSSSGCSATAGPWTTPAPSRCRTRSRR
jgi:class 3 adenylate cyclase